MLGWKGWVTHRVVWNMEIGFCERYREYVIGAAGKLSSGGICTTKERFVVIHCALKFSL